MGIPNNNPFNTIKCGVGADTNKSLVFGNSNISIVQGANTLFTLPLTDYMPVSIYQYKEFTLAPNTSPSTGDNAVQLEACNTTTDSGEDSVIVIVAQYPDFDTADLSVPTNEKYINYTFPDGSDVMNIGKVMILSGSSKAGSGWNLSDGLVLTNPHANFAVNIKVLIVA